ncbi:type III-B CRISPR module RAMP protein Cmr1 [Saccharolobus islandicus]|uniref:CRISPR-associated RAMP protein, Cmr1 family n=1 Tax=Saccharolobus islandicus (strain M.16.27) TaxID=427318 RepID=C3N4P8_SACI3|nr:type III-B CRISPR module RAMP protein Cmr1 [Sulfolobus islandicus]ACP54973.1 CRISPR-associated RAMP protein, Cmr1 family [Sulfolobus islandicus M.16.27]
MYKEILSIDAIALYPIVGGYNSYPVSLTVGYDEPIRATEIKGLWKWWTRILLESVIFRQKNCVVPYSEIDKVMEDIFGSEDRKSLVRIDVKVNDDFVSVAEKIWQFLRSFFQKGQVINQRNVSSQNNITIQAQSLNINIKNIYVVNINTYNNLKNIRVRRADRDPKPDDIFIVIDFDNKKISIRGVGELKLEGLDKYLTIDIMRDFLSIPRIRLDMLRYNNIGLKVENLDDRELNELVRIILDLITTVLIPKEVKFTISIKVDMERLKNEKNELDTNKVKKLEFALRSLFVYLILGAIGRMTNRGMGSLSPTPTRINCHDDNLCKDLKPLSENFSKISNEDEIAKFIKELVDFNKLEELSRNYINEIEITSKANKVFYISDYSLKYFYVKEILEPLKCLKALGELTLSNNVNDIVFARKILGSPRKRDDIRLPSAFRFKILYIANKYYLIWYLLDRYSNENSSHSLIKDYEKKIDYFIKNAQQKLGEVR